MEVCLQGHLQSTSHRLPVTPPTRRPQLLFLQARRTARRRHHPLRQAATDLRHAHRLPPDTAPACYQKSKLTCTTCHDPHKPAERSPVTTRPAAIATRRATTCGGRTAAKRHMPKRRTDDAVACPLYGPSTRTPAARTRPARRKTRGNSAIQTRTAIRRGAARPAHRRRPPLRRAGPSHRRHQPASRHPAIGAPRSPCAHQTPSSTSNWASPTYAPANPHSRSAGSNRACKDNRKPPNPASMPLPSTRWATADAIRVLESTPREDAAVLKMPGATYLNAKRTEDAIHALQQAAQA